MSITLASAILRGTWLIDPAIARTQLPILENILNGNTKFEPLTEEEKSAREPKNFIVGFAGAGKAHAVNVYAAANAPSGTSERTKTVQVIPVIGVMLKYSEECGPIGTTDIARRIEAANANPNVDAIVIKIDSPGGMVDGTQTLTDAIKKSTKPVIGFIDDGMACSAGYWAASSCTEIIASQETDVIGSIGVYVTLADFKKKYEASGLPIHEIYSDRSSEKNKTYRDALAGDYKGIKEKMLNPIADKFIASVKENRAGKINTDVADPFKGDTYMALRAIEIGLIDSIGSFNTAIQRAAELSDQNKPVANTNNTQSKTDMKIKLLATQTLLASVIGATFAQGETEKEIELTPENINAISDRLNSDANAISTANEAKATLEKDKGVLTDSLATANAEITRLGKQPGAGAADPPTGDPEGGKKEASDDGVLCGADADLKKLKADLGLS